MFKFQKVPSSKSIVAWPAAPRAAEMDMAKPMNISTRQPANMYGRKPVKSYLGISTPLWVVCCKTEWIWGCSQLPTEIKTPGLISWQIGCRWQFVIFQFLRVSCWESWTGQNVTTEVVGRQNEESEKHMFDFMPSYVVWRLKSMSAKVTKALVEDHCSLLYMYIAVMNFPKNRRWSPVGHPAGLRSNSPCCLYGIRFFMSQLPPILLGNI